jgi:hypothetical protein
MMPDDKKNKMVQIYHNGYLRGLKFFDQNKLLIFEIGNTDSAWDVTEVVLKDNEQIIGVV